MFKNFVILTLAILTIRGGYSSDSFSSSMREDHERSLCVYSSSSSFLSRENGVFERIVACLTENEAEFRVIEHEAETRSNSIIDILTRNLGQEIDLSKAAKAMITLSSFPSNQGKEVYNLVVLPGNEILDLKLLSSVLGMKKTRLAPIEKIEEITTCKVGAVPPFSFFPDTSITLMVDTSLVDKNKDGGIFFTPGRADRSIFLKTDDYLRITRPQLVNVIKRVVR